MPFLTYDQLTAKLRIGPLRELARELIFEGEPFVFRRAPEAYALLREHLHSELGIQENEVFVVGSGKTGFSVSPDSFGRPFSRRSDIDVVLVDSAIFDRLWITLLEWHYPRRTGRLGGADWQWVKDRRDDLYWGRFFDRDVRPQWSAISLRRPLQYWMDFSTRWFEAFQSLSRYEVFSPWHVSGRLYRTREHAIEYHAEGLRQVAKLVR